MIDDIESSMQIVRKFVGANLTRSVFADACIDLLDEIERLHAEINDLRLHLVALLFPKEVRRD